MNAVRFFKEAISSLLSNKMRTFLTMLGIVIGVAAVISMMAIGNGAQESITSSIESMGTNLIFISQNNDASNPEALTLSDATAISEAATQYIAAVAPSVQNSVSVSYSGNSITAQIYGVTPEYESVRNTAVSEGSFITQSQVDERSTVAVIGVDIAEELFNTTQNVVGNKIRMGSYVYTVIGLLEKQGGSFSGSSDNQVFIPITTAQARIISRTNAHDEISMISISATSSDDMESAIEEVTKVMQNQHGILGGEENDFTVMSQESITEAASSITGVLTIFLGGIAAISLLVGGIGIMNIMLVTVVERTREIGLRKAVGARKRDILTQFLIEALVIGLVGGILGVLVGAGISAVISKIAAFSETVLNPKVSFSSVLLSTLFSIGVGLVFGIYPANRAANLEPVEALRTE